MNTDLCALEEWSARWLVTFNPSKTEVLYINATGSDDIELQFGGTTLHNVNEHKHLGITLMSNGKWTSIYIMNKSLYKGQMHPYLN